MSTELIIDSSVAIKWLTKEVLDNEANDVLVRWGSNEFVCLAPDILFAEVGNILWKKHRQGIMSSGQIDYGLKQFMAYPFVVVASTELIEPAMKIAILHDRTFYDSLFLALAQAQKCPLVTADDRLANAVAPHIPNVVKLSDWKRSPPTTPPPTTTTSP